MPGYSNPDNESKSDLDDHANAVLSHSSAAAREKDLKEEGTKSVSILFLLISGLVLVVGVMALRGGGRLFSYSDYVKPNYERASSPFDEKVEVLKGPIGLALMEKGAKVYSKCAPCHHADGIGPGVFPPLAGSEWVQGDNTQALAIIILNGLKGPITVKGKQWNSNMPAQGAGLGAVELAALMTYIRASFGNQASVVTPEMATVALEISKTRAGGADMAPQLTEEELLSKHAAALPGTPLKAETIVNLETYQPIATEK